MERRIKVASIVIAAGIGVGAVLVDTKSVREKSALVENRSTGSTYGSNLKDQEDDINRESNCTWKLYYSQDKEAAISSVEWRDCIVQAMPLTKTFLGGAEVVTDAALWLKKHPDDTVVKASALQVIEVMRADLLHSISWFDLLEDSETARRSSIFYRLVWPTSGSGNMFPKLVQNINNMEYRLQNPDLFYKQMDWLNKAIVVSKTASDAPAANETKRLN